MTPTVHEVRQRHESALLALPGVVGVADGFADGQPVINVLVADDTVGSRRGIPSQLEGYPVQVITAGEIDAQK